MSVPTTRFIFGTFVFQPELRYLSRQSGDGPASRVRLAGAEAAILAHLLTHPDEVCSKDDLLAIGWQGRQVSTNSLPVAIGNLRRHLHMAPYEVEIRNLPRQGYLLNALVAVSIERQLPAAADAPAGIDTAPQAGAGTDELAESTKSIEPAESAAPADLPPPAALLPVARQSKPAPSRWLQRLWLLNIVIVTGGIALALVSYHEWIDIRCRSDRQGTVCEVADRANPDVALPAQRQGKLVLVSGAYVQVVDAEKTEQ
ncbi:hypothetical protein BJP62_07135 [Jeongeupia sp. USM3]|nr:hypothetical protein BJP62_07135 [Jeongeupia sp. USM3]